MKKTKRITSLMLVITLALSIAGCKIKSDTSASQQESATQLTTKAISTASMTDNTTVSTVPMTDITTAPTATMTANTTVSTESMTMVPTTVPTTTVNPFDSEDSETTTLAIEITSEDEDYEEESTVSDIMEDDESNQDTYIQVSISMQTLRYYKEGKIVLESPVVTGTEYSTPTPTGEFWVNNKAQNIVLYGEDYASPVKYWIAFYGSGYGFHDASWRYNFGGDIYTYDGSHGCVNMPLEAVAELYDLVEIGTPVFIE